ncbi:acyltransferase [Tsukamurella soli]|uniref:acyltransferase family protein n=1 Tax=Tsukamurella soli TaxID=644556 RepID=UPI0031E9E72E
MSALRSTPAARAGGAPPAPAVPAGAAGFVPALEGMRALAATAVMLTHIAFQTGQVNDTVAGRVWGRFDMAVAVFFGLSGFLLWRAHARAAWTDAPAPSAARYYRSRLVRILPAYLVVVVVVLAVLPEARGASPSTWLANLTLTQVFVPFSLTEGLTQMWSLSVEMQFYLLVPLVAVLLAGLRGPRARLRVPLLMAAALVSGSWAWLGAGLHLARGVNYMNWIPGYVPWFVAGLALAELAVAPTDRYVRIRRFAARRWLCWAAAALTFAVIATPLGGPVTLDTPARWQFATRMLLGGVLGFLLLAPLVLPPSARPGGRRWRLLDSGPMQALGRWSYGVFIWHLVILSSVFPLFGIMPFHGRMGYVAVLTVVFAAAVSAVSYSWVEEPFRAALARWEAARRPDSPRRDPPSDPPPSDPVTGSTDQASTAIPASANP